MCIQRASKNLFPLNLHEHTHILWTAEAIGKTSWYKSDCLCRSLQECFVYFSFSCILSASLIPSLFNYQKVFFLFIKYVSKHCLVEKYQFDICIFFLCSLCLLENFWPLKNKFSYSNIFCIWNEKSWFLTGPITVFWICVCPIRMTVEFFPHF